MVGLAYRLALVSTCALFAAACARPSQVTVLSTERPSAQGAQEGAQPPSPANAASPSNELPNDEEVVEPDHPAAESKQERALVHIHGPNDVVCSGVVLGPRIIATSQQCLKGEAKGVTTFPPARSYRVEIASSTLTWTNRRVQAAVLPSCDWTELDVAILVLAEAAPSLVQPLTIIAAPNTGAKVQALGFGRCPGEVRAIPDRVGTVRSRVSEAIVIDVPLCRGDVGGPVVDAEGGDVIGLISRRDDPEGSPLRTTTITRLDTTHARELVEQAKLLASGGDSTKVSSIACR